MEMENTLYPTKEAFYMKFVYTPDDLGIGVTLYLDAPGWELSFRLLCWQVWIGR